MFVITCSCLNCPHICQFIDIISDEGEFYIFLVPDLFTKNNNGFFLALSFLKTNVEMR